MRSHIFLATLLPALLQAQAPPANAPSPSSMADPVLATLGGAPIRESEFQAFLQGFDADHRAQVATSAQVREEALAAFLDRRVLLAKARKEGLEGDPTYRKACQLMEMNLLVRALRDKDRVRLVKGLEVTEAEAKADYEARQDLYRVDPGFTARQILVFMKGNPAFPDRGLEEPLARAKAEEARARLKAGEGWDTVAQAYSDDSSTRGQGGLIRDGRFSYYPPEMQNALRTQPLGALGEPVRSSFGYHVLQVEGRTVEGQRQPFEKVKSFILDRLSSAKRASRNKAYLDPIKAEVGLKPAAGAGADPLVATLGGTEIHDSDFQWFLRDAYQPRQRTDILAQPKVRQDVLQSYLELRALEAKARKEGLDQGKAFQETRAAQRDGLLVEFLEGREKETLRRASMPSEEELRAYYTANPDEFRAAEPSFSARQIFVLVKGGPGDAGLATREAQAKARAGEALARLRAGESWSTVARLMSDDAATSHTGGLMENAEPQRFAPELLPALRAQPLGRPGEPIRAAHGYYVLQVDSRITEQDAEPFEKVRGRILRRLGPAKEEEARRAMAGRLRGEMGLVRVRNDR